MIRPYLVIPTLIPQPTWGGSYIVSLKGWSDRPQLSKLKIGQSFELSGNTYLEQNITDTNDPTFSPVLADSLGNVIDPTSALRGRLSLSALIAHYPTGVLGDGSSDGKSTMPLLIKLNQAMGNSFQLHIKPGQSHPHWRPKPESWYFIEDGYITCGIRPNTSQNEYKECCTSIEMFMTSLSSRVVAGEISLEDARKEAGKFISLKNPWQFVNTYNIKKGSVIDLSGGAVTHSWEEKKENTLGNVIYEVQLDVPDEFCTIRAFDQGKIKDDGTIRRIHVDDYFKFLNSDPDENALESLQKQFTQKKYLKTRYYSLCPVDLQEEELVHTGSSFHHIFVESGVVEIRGGATRLRVGCGHSCFIPCNVATYTAKPLAPQTRILRTFIE